jgi:hypothetical protein
MGKASVTISVFDAKIRTDFDVSGALVLPEDKGPVTLRPTPAV